MIFTLPEMLTAAAKRSVCVMSNEVAAVSPDEIVISAANIMSDKKISCLVVMDQGNIAGIVTETDLLRRISRNGKDFYRTKLSQIMSSPL